MTKPVPASGSRSLLKGLLAGLIGGLAGVAAKSLAEQVYPPRDRRKDGRPAPPEALAEKVAGNSLTRPQEVAAGEAIHWSFGPLMGAAYGALAEFAPVVTDRNGVSFGVALCSLTHEGALPALGLADEPKDQPFREQSSEMISHSVYGFVTEIVRRQVRKLL